jgi:hypothetical protein
MILSLKCIQPQRRAYRQKLLTYPTSRKREEEDFDPSF